MKAILLFALATLPCAAQFRSIKIWFNGIGCASCTESMTERARRLRGVESAKLDAQAGTLDVRLAEQNRVRLEQIRDLIEQDGTKAVRAAVRVGGDLSKTNDRWMLRPPGASWEYEITGPDLTAGTRVITGEVRELHATSGILRIQVSPTDSR